MSENTTEFKLRLEGDGISVNKIINEEMARRIFNIILGTPFGPNYADSSRINSAIKNTSDTSSVRLSTPPSSLREHLDESQAKTNPEKILAIAAYLLDQANSDTFGQDEIKNQFPNAREKPPANYSRDFRWVQSNGWISEHHQQPGRFYITKTGQKALTEKFPNELSKPQPGYKKTKKKANT
jgi:hypothetical protein